MVRDLNVLVVRTFSVSILHVRQFWVGGKICFLFSSRIRLRVILIGHFDRTLRGLNLHVY